MTLRNALLLIATCAGITCASGQNLSKTTQATCPASQDLTALQLYGQWQVHIDGQPGTASLQLEKDPEQNDSLVGTLVRADKRAQVAGELEQGAFNLEESDDGTRISATWAGQVREGSCGKEITGLWTNTLQDNATPQAFILRKPAGWQ